MKSTVTQSEPSSKCYRKSGGNDDPEELEVIYMSESKCNSNTYHSIYNYYLEFYVVPGSP